MAGKFKVPFLLLLSQLKGKPGKGEIIIGFHTMKGVSV